MPKKPFKKTTVTITGGPELIKKLKALGPKAIDAAAASLYQSAQMIMTDSMENYVPVDVGNLRDSGHVALPEKSDKEVAVALGFGGPAGSGNNGTQTNKADVGYAVYVHENLNAYHTVGQAKYLERPAKKAIKYIQEALKEDIEDAFAGI